MNYFKLKLRKGKRTAHVAFVQREWRRGDSSLSPHPIPTLHAGHVDSVKVQIKAYRKKYSTNQTVPKFKFKRALSSGGKLEVRQIILSNARR